MAESPHIVLGVSGSIAAYKAAELVRLMKTRGWQVTVAMTASATNYVGELTFRALTGNKVATAGFSQDADEAFEHIDLGLEADVILIAPCTANVMAKLACGLADDLLTATVLASTAPLIVAPAMNTRMWRHPATRANVETLKQRKVTVLPVGEGDLACGEVGEGRLTDLDTILEAVASALK
jgi:phosphopantothenoylcysteine decarboxylase/phosphopantothenate--cysteine ligase